MKKTITIIIIFSLFSLLSSCSNNKKNEENAKKIEPAELYQTAMLNIKSKKYEEATSAFDKIIYEFPLSNEGIQSQIMLAFIDYLKLEYESAIYKFDKVIKLYPSHKNIDYAFYMRAMCYFEQIENEELDGLNNQLALSNFMEIISRFPNSNYAKDSRQKIIL